MRDAPSLVIIDELVKTGAIVVGYDPVAIPECKRRIADKISYAANPYEAIKDVDALLLVTEWKEFRVPKWTEMESLMKNKLIFDGRNIYEPEDMKKWGWNYYGIGR
jgi:UDPglucose 6-dehydrogenase